MKGRQILLDQMEGRAAAAMLVDGQLEDFLIEGDAPAPGTIYRARIGRPMKGQGGVFLSTPDGSAYLRGARGLTPGAHLLVQVTGYSEPGKAVPVTRRLLFKSRYAIVTPEAPGLNISRRVRDEQVRDRLLALAHDGMGDHPFGLILRSSCAGADAAEVEADIADMVAAATRVLGDGGNIAERLVDGDTPHELAWREWTDPAEVFRDGAVFDEHGIPELIAAARTPRSPLPGGGHVTIETTRALVAVDVNTGPDSSPAAGLKANIACARALPRLLRLRGLGGQITIDPAPMAKKDRRALESAFRTAFRTDTEDTVLAGWTPLGNLELQRKRGRVPLEEVLN